MDYKDRRFNPDIAAMARKKMAEFLIIRRKELGLSQQELAAMVGIRRASITAIESGNTNFTIDSFIAVLGCLRCELKIEAKDIDSIPGYEKPNSN